MELGSEYNLSLSELNIEQDNIFNYLSEFDNCFFFDSGRSAIKHISKHLNIETIVFMPEFICESVINCFEQSRIIYYKIKDDFTVDIDDLADKVKNRPGIIFLMHYFGVLQPKMVLDEIKSIADSSGAVIVEDTTHSIFTRLHTIGDYMVCSIRKWMPIPGGGILYYNGNKLKLNKPNYSRSNGNLRCYGMILKDLFLQRNFDYNQDYRELFIESERILDKQKEIFKISDLSKFIASCICINKIKEKRKTNLELIIAKLKEMNINPAIGFRSSDIPLTLPIRVHNRDHLRKFLIDKNIYCAVHWPFDNNQPAQRMFARRNADELISLPIDQRYNGDHIVYLTNMLYKYGGGKLF